jgi:hypothetical protein
MELPPETAMLEAAEALLRAIEPFSGRSMRFCASSFRFVWASAELREGIACSKVTNDLAGYRWKVQHIKS